MFRRLIPLTLAATLLALASARPDDSDKGWGLYEGFTRLFNGKDLAGWKASGKMEDWGVDGTTLYTKGGGGGWLMTDKEYGDFEVYVDFKMPMEGGGNSGVAIRAPFEGDAAYKGMEIQLLDDAWYKDPANYKGIRPAQLTGSVYGVVPPSKDATRPAGEWNTLRITARGRHVRVELNGVKTVDADLDEHKDAFGAHPGLTRDKGHIGLQSHSNRVEFRNIYVKELSGN
jgi:3-keto-disaccharide hydrolase